MISLWRKRRRKVGLLAMLMPISAALHPTHVLRPRLSTEEATRLRVWQLVFWWQLVFPLPGAL